MGKWNYEVAWKMAEDSRKKQSICCSIKLLVKMKNACFIYLKTELTFWQYKKKNPTIIWMLLIHQIKFKISLKGKSYISKNRRKPVILYQWLHKASPLMDKWQKLYHKARDKRRMPTKTITFHTCICSKQCSCFKQCSKTWHIFKKQMIMIFLEKFQGISSEMISQL